MPSAALKTAVIQTSKLKLNQAELRLCATALAAGGVVIFPTDTVYGMAANAFHIEGVKRIYALKGRSYKKPLPIFLARADQVSLVAHGIPHEAERLMKAFWPGPLTLVFKTAPMALHVVHGRSTLAVRIPDHGLVRQILEAAQVPLAVTSANRSGRPSLKTGHEACREFDGRVDVIVDGGPCPIGKESTVIDASHYPFTILRAGAIPKGKLAAALNL